MLNRIIIKLIMCKLGLRKGEYFQFANQHNKHSFYYFEDEKLMKHSGKNKPYKSQVPLNFLLSDECEIVKRGVE